MTASDLTTDEANFNRLTPKETEALALLAEECAEVVQIVGKILRHGLDSWHPDTGQGNRALLAKEIGDVRAAMIIAFDEGVADRVLANDAMVNKLKRVGMYLHHVKVRV